MEAVYSKKITIDHTAVDRYGRLRSSMLLRYSQQIAGEDRLHVAQDHDQLALRGLFWAIVRNRVQISRMPMVDETITIETWPMPTTRTAYPRSTVAYDAQGNELFRSVSLWVLMDVRSRALVLPAKSGVEVRGQLMGNELASPRSLSPSVLANLRHRPVRFTDLDRNGHMNNARYLDWIDDLLPSDYHRTHPISDMTLCYMNEAREAESLTISWDTDPQGDLLVQIDRPKQDDHDRIFAARISYHQG